MPKGVLRRCAPPHVIPNGLVLLVIHPEVSQLPHMVWFRSFQACARAHPCTAGRGARLVALAGSKLGVGTLPGLADPRRRREGLALGPQH